MSKESKKHAEEHSHEGSKGHDHGDLKGKKLAVTIFLNLFVTLAQAAGGIFSGSLSLISDALHNFCDVIALVISYIADRLNKKEFTAKQTFGYKRAEIIAALINAITLIGIAANLGWEAIARFNHPVEIETITVILLAGLSILVNGGSVFLLKKEASESLNIKSAYLHLLSDMITSVAVLLGGVAMYYWKIYWIDSVLSIIISLYLAYFSWGLLLQALKVLMQFAPSDLDLEKLKEEVLKFPGIESIYHVHLWQLNEREVHINAHLNFKEDVKLSDSTKITAQIEKMFKSKFRISHAALQQEFGVEGIKKHLIFDER